MDLDERMAAELAALEQAGNLRSLNTLLTDGAYLHRGTERFLNLSSNDYLGLGCTPYAEVNLAQYWATRFPDCPRSPHAGGNPASRLMTGNSPEYDAVEAELAALFPGKAALVLGCGFMANSGLMPALAQKGDLVLADKLVHASIIEGLMHTDAAFRRFPHNDTAALERLLAAAAGKHGNTWVIIESLYSMDGDLAPMQQILELKDKYGFRLYVDEAHSFGTRGPAGAGYCAELGVADRVDLMVVTFGKALSGAGAAVICPPLMRRYLVNRMRPLIFSTALPPHTLMWVGMVLHEMRTDSLHAETPALYPGMHTLRARLAELVQWFSRESGIPAQSQIIPLPCGSNERALAVAAQGRQEALWLTAIRHPTVPVGTARIRLSLHAALTPRQLAPLVELCRKLG